MNRADATTPTFLRVCSLAARQCRQCGQAIPPRAPSVILRVRAWGQDYHRWCEPCGRDLVGQIVDHKAQWTILRQRGGYELAAVHATRRSDWLDAMQGLEEYA